MAREVGSPSASGVSSTQQIHASAHENSVQASLDLNLTQRTSQNFVQGHGEKQGLQRRRTTEAFGSSPSKWTVEVLARDGNGNAPIRDEHSREQAFHQTATPPPQPNHEPDTAGANNEVPQRLVLGNEDGALAINGSPRPTSRLKRKSLKVEAVAKAQKEQLLCGNLTSPGESNGPSPPLLVWKGKSPCMQQQTTTDVTKTVILALEANDDEEVSRSKIKRGSSNDSKDLAAGTQRSRSRVRKNAEPSGMEERRLLLEERKIRLAEQRFSLEEKKLQATIEIGKGLIFSMERMTSTIANLGFPSVHHP